MTYGESPYIHGMHDPGGEALDADRPGWRVFTEAIGADPNDRGGGDYSWWADRGYGVIVRLNYGYAPLGTIPTPDRYADFAQRVGNFVAASRGCTHWIIGNEPNHSQERPGGRVIDPADYAKCFLACRGAIHLAQGRPTVLPAPVAPWNLETGDWLDYWSVVLTLLADAAAIDGLALHAYTHGADPSLIYSDERRHDWLWHFRTYRDQLAVAREYVHNVPVFITECNQGDAAWVDVNSGWVQNVYDEIDTWNGDHADQVIRAVCLYRWPDADRWGIESKAGVHADYRVAAFLGYTWTVEEETVGIVNAGLDLPYVGMQNHANIRTANGWTPWWLPEGNEGGEAGQPEYKPITPDVDPYRVLSGDASQCWFIRWRIMNGGIAQQVNVGAGKRVTFRAPFHVWCSQSDDPAADDGELYVRVGIDPRGGTDPQEVGIVWGEWTRGTRAWQTIGVSTVSETDTITVYVQGWNKWSMAHNDVYVDEVELEVEGGTEPPDPPAPGEPGDYEVCLVATIGGLEIPITGTVRMVEP